MAIDTWNSVAIPLLEHIATHEPEYSESTGAVSVAELAAVTGLEATAIALELRRLFDGGYLDGRYERESPAEESWLMIPTLSERGARAVGRWPSNDPAEAMLTIIERRLEAAGTPEERTFWRKIKDGFAGVPANLVGSLAVEVGKVVGGLS